MWVNYDVFVLYKMRKKMKMNVPCASASKLFFYVLLVYWMSAFIICVLFAKCVPLIRNANKPLESYNLIKMRMYLLIFLLIFQLLGTL